MGYNCEVRVVVMFIIIWLEGKKKKFFQPKSWRYFRGVELYLHCFLTSELDGDKWATSRFGHLFLWKEPRYPLNRKSCVPQIRSGILEKKKFYCQCLNSNPGWSSSYRQFLIF